MSDLQAIADRVEIEALRGSWDPGPLVKEVVQGGGDQVRCFFWQEVAGGQFVAAGVGGVLLPDVQRLVAATDEPLRSP